MLVGSGNRIVLAPGAGLLVLRHTTSTIGPFDYMSLVNDNNCSILDCGQCVEGLAVNSPSGTIALLPFTQNDELHGADRWRAIFPSDGHPDSSIIVVVMHTSMGNNGNCYDPPAGRGGLSLHRLGAIGIDICGTQSTDQADHSEIVSAKGNTSDAQARAKTNIAARRPGRHVARRNTDSGVAEFESMDMGSLLKRSRRA